MSSLTQLKFKDEDGSDTTNVLRASVTPVENGFILNIDCDEDEWQEVFVDKSELLKRMSELL